MGHKLEIPTQLKNGAVVDDPRLGRVPQFDPRSREFDVRETIAQLDQAPLRNHSWQCQIVLDQGSTSACTGNARTYDLASSPNPLRYPSSKQLLDEAFAQQLYNRARQLDEWPGEDYEGSSVLGALKAAVDQGFIGEYRWAFDIDDMYQALAHVGGVVVGTTWFNSMFDPQPNGLMVVDPASGSAGGHSYYFRRIAVTHDHKREILGKGVEIRDVPLLGLRNSWGLGWGHKGEAWMWGDDYRNHLWDGGEQSVVTQAFHR